MKIPSIKFKLPKIKIYGIDVIKNALFFSFSVILTLIIIAFIIAPSIKTFKYAKIQYFSNQQTFTQVQKQYKQILNNLDILKNKNQKIITALQRKFNKKNFILFAKNYMQIKNIKELNSSVYKEKFLKTPYLITALIKSPENFYKFVDNIKNYKNVIKVYFPLDFEKNGEEINLTFKIECFNLLKKGKK